MFGAWGEILEKPETSPDRCWDPMIRRDQPVEPMTLSDSRRYQSSKYLIYPIFPIIFVWKLSGSNPLNPFSFSKTIRVFMIRDILDRRAPASRSLFPV